MIRAHREHGFASLGMLGLILTVATVALPVAMPSVAANSCAGRLICGPVHLWPHGAAQRQRLIAQIVASFITARAAAAANRRHSVSASFVDSHGLPLGGSAMFSRQLVVTGATPPSLATSLIRYLAVDAAEHAVQSTFRVSDFEQQRWARLEAIASLGDTLRWRTVFAANRQISAEAAQCQRSLSAAHAFVIVAPHMPRVPVVNGPFAASACAPFIANSFGVQPSGGGPIVYEASNAPIALPTAHVSAGDHFSLFTLAAQAVIVPSAHAVRHAGPIRIARGPIRIVPRDLDERRALFTNLGSALVDGLITQRGTRGDPRLEANPLVRPFVRGGLTSMMAAWTGQMIIRDALVHSRQMRTAFDDREASEHVRGIASWLSPAAYSFAGVPPSLYLKVPQTQALWFYFDSKGER